MENCTPPKTIFFLLSVEIIIFQNLLEGPIMKIYFDFETQFPHKLGTNIFQQELNGQFSFLWWAILMGNNWFRSSHWNSKRSEMAESVIGFERLRHSNCFFFNITCLQEFNRQNLTWRGLFNSKIGSFLCSQGNQNHRQKSKFANTAINKGMSGCSNNSNVNVFPYFLFKEMIFYWKVRMSARE